MEKDRDGIGWDGMGWMRDRLHLYCLPGQTVGIRVGRGRRQDWGEMQAAGKVASSVPRSAADNTPSCNRESSLSSHQCTGTQGLQADTNSIMLASFLGGVFSLLPLLSLGFLFTLRFFCVFTPRLDLQGKNIQ